MIRLGIVGCNYGRMVQLPAFRLDPRCQVMAIAGTDAARTAAIARDADIPNAFGDWRQLIDRDDIDAVAISTPPRVQPEIAIAALRHGKAVFAEKPMAADPEGAAAMLRAAGLLPTMLDFGFTEITAWKKAKALLDAGTVGTLRHVVVKWLVENASTRQRLKNWKTSIDQGGGALGNFASHSLHYLEWFCGPIAGLTAQLSSLPDDPSFQIGVTLALRFQSGATGSLVLNCASFPGSGHHLEFYGQDGALILSNSTADYMRGFALTHARRPTTALVPVAIEHDDVDRKFPQEGRIAPVSRLAQSFLDGVEQRRTVSPGFAEGCRVQALIDAVQRSHGTGRWIDTDPKALT